MDSGSRRDCECPNGLPGPPRFGGARVSTATAAAAATIKTDLNSAGCSMGDPDLSNDVPKSTVCARLTAVTDTGRCPEWRSYGPEWGSYGNLRRHRKSKYCWLLVKAVCRSLHVGRQRSER